MNAKLLGTILITTSVLCLSSLSITSTSYAIPIEQVTNPRQQANGWVADEANILSPSAIAQLNQAISQLKTETGAEIAVVTVPDTSPYASAKEYATELFNRWGIGEKGKDNGVLFLISVKERRTEIETGYGVEGILPDAKVVNILNTAVIPYFKKGNYQQGIVTGTQALIDALATVPATEYDSPVSDDADLPLDLLIVAGGGAAIIGGGVFYLKNRKRFLEPEGRSEGRSLNSKPNFYCAKCGTLMEELDKAALDDKLNYAQKFSQQILSSDYRGWRCPNCSHQVVGRGFHLRTYRLNRNYKLCPSCEEYNLTEEVNVLQPATTYSTGLKRRIAHCDCCNYHQEHDEIIPIERPTVIVTTSSGGSSWGGGGSSGSSGGGGSFGGGSSGGGGGGSSW